jgi:uncharacterized protein (DUF58 family)
VREALAGLTLRGRAFLAAGVSALACAIVLGQEPLVRAGVLVLALPLVTAAVLARSRYRLSLDRTLTPQHLAAGQTARVRLTLTNEGRVPSGALLLEDQLPYVLGTRPRFVLEGIGQGWTRTIEYAVRSDVRGRFEVGPMTVRVRDPFGMVQLGRSFRGTTPLVVTPRTVPLPAIPLEGGHRGSGDNRPRAFAVGTAEDVGIREYRRGDDLRRVHWRSSARAGELMVRREEQPGQSRLTLLVDNRSRAHRGQGVGSTLEAAVSAAASVGVHLTRRGYDVRLVTASGLESSSHARPRDAGPDAGPLLESLAVLGADRGGGLDTGWLGDGRTGLLVAVLGAVGEDDLPVLHRLAQHADTALAVLLDVDGWAAGSPGRAVAEGRRGLLAGQGWRVATLGPRDRLDAVWQELGHRTVRSTAAAR